jgi:hypothetical protein
VEYRLGQVKHRGNLKRAARRQQIQNPFQISMAELKARLVRNKTTTSGRMENDIKRNISYKESRRQEKRAKKTLWQRSWQLSKESRTKLSGSG